MHHSRYATLLVIGTLLAPLVPALAAVDLTDPEPEGDGPSAVPVMPGAPPDGLGTADPWIDATGDSMFGTLDMGAHPILLNGGALTSPSFGNVSISGRPLCIGGTTPTCGTVTSVGAGAGLAGGPITNSGSLKLRDCAASQVLKSGGAGVWSCANDASTTYNAASPLTLNGVTFGLTSACADQQILKWNGSSASWTCVADQKGWSLTGDAGTNAATSFLGTTDNQPLVLKVNGQRALRIEPGQTPNLIGGSSFNSVSPGVMGAAIGGGGLSNSPNMVNGDFGTIGGGIDNLAGDASGTSLYGTVGGGYRNRATGLGATVGGGELNEAGQARATVAGGFNNRASGPDSAVGGGFANDASGTSSFIGGGALNFASGKYGVIGGGGGYIGSINGGNAVTDDHGTVAGGWNNTAGDATGTSTSATHATVGGGTSNWARDHGSWVGGGVRNTAYVDYSSVAGGHGNNASGLASSIAGGEDNSARGTLAFVAGGKANVAEGYASFAAGSQASAIHIGAFVWADPSSASRFSSTESNQFIVRAAGGVGINTNVTDSTLVVAGDGTGKARIGGESGCGGNFAAIGLNGQTMTGCTNYNLLSSPTDTHLYINRPQGSEIRFRQNNSDQLVLTSSGKVHVDPLDKGGNGLAHGLVFGGGGSGEGITSTRQSGYSNLYGLDFRTGHAQRMSIDIAGRVGIGTVTPADKLDVDGDIRVGTIMKGCVKDRDTTVIAGTCSSDARFKKNIRPYDSVLDKLAALVPVRFDWRADEFPDKHFGTNGSFGLIAQDVEAVMPELVVEDEDGYKAVRYHELPMLLLQGVKDLKAQNDALAEENAMLKERLDRLEAIVLGAER